VGGSDKSWLTCVWSSIRQAAVFHTVVQDNVQVRLASLHFSDVKFPQHSIHQKLFLKIGSFFAELFKISKG